MNTYSLEEGRRANAIWTESQNCTLLRHLHGSNSGTHFIAGFTASHPSEPGTFVSKYSHNKTQTVATAIRSTWSSIIGNSPRPYALVLLATPGTKIRAAVSTWSVFDFDFHATPEDRFSADMQADIRRFHNAASAWQNQDMGFIIEDSGRGWHLWLVSTSPKTAREWYEIQCCIRATANFMGRFEVYPSFNGEGTGCRAPGSDNISSWHPTREDWITSLIHADNVTQQLQLNKENDFSFVVVDDSEQGSEASQAPWMELALKHQITEPQIRHNTLVSMIGEGCFQMGKAALEKAARHLHEHAQPPCQTPLEDHLAEFEIAYDDAMEKLVLPKLSAEESVVYERLSTPFKKGLVIAAQNFARYGRGEFSLSTTREAQNFEVSPKAVSLARKEYVKDGIMERLPGGYVPGKKAFRYRWLLPFNPGASK